MNSREFRRHIADLLARQRRAGYEGTAEPEAKKPPESASRQGAVTKKPPTKETVKVKTRRKKA